MYKLDYKLTPIPHHFEKGEILKNNNNSIYRVIEATLQSKVVFERVTDGYQLIGIIPKLYTKSYTDGKQETVLEWARSIELGWKNKKAPS